MNNSEIWTDKRKIDKHAEELAKLSKDYLKEHNELITFMQQTNGKWQDQVYRDFQKHISKEQKFIEDLNKDMQMYSVYLKKVSGKLAKYFGSKTSRK